MSIALPARTTLSTSSTGSTTLQAAADRFPEDDPDDKPVKLGPVRILRRPRRERARLRRYLLRLILF